MVIKQVYLQMMLKRVEPIGISVIKFTLLFILYARTETKDKNSCINGRFEKYTWSITIMTRLVVIC